MKNNNTTIKKYISKSMISVFTCSVLATGVFANPTGGTVASGTAAIGGTSTAMTVTQTTQNAIINWTGFNVANGESVAFTGGNATLNRISDVNPSTIAGSVTGDHALFFVNPNGMVVTGTMSAPTIVLSTSDVSDTDFNNGTYKFTRGSAIGTITNNGTIGDGGLAGNIGVAALFATTVTNTGTISAHNVAIVAADDVTLGATTSAVANGNYDATQNGYSGVTINTASTVATSIVNTAATIHATDNGVNSGNIDIYSTNGTIDNSNYGNISSFSPNGSSGTIIVNASGDITNAGGAITSQTNSTGSSGAITVTSTNGAINNAGGQIFDLSDSSSSGDVTVSAYGDITNTYGMIASIATGSSSGAVSVTSTNGVIANGSGHISSSSNGSSGDITVSAYGDITNTSGYIYSNTNGNASSGAVSVTSTNGAIANDNGQIYSSSTSNYGGNGSSGDIIVSAYGDITNTSGYIYSLTYGKGSSGAVSVTSTNGAIANDNGQIYSSASNYGGNGSSGDIIVSAYGDITNIDGLIYSFTQGTGSSGAVSVTSTNGAIASHNGRIYSISNYGSSGDVTVSATGDITNTNGSIYSQTYSTGSSGAVSVTSTNGVIANDNGYIYSASNGSSGAITLSATGDITNTNGQIYSLTYGSGSSSGAISVISTTGAIDNSNGANIYSSSGNGSSGSITLDASTQIDTTSGLIYSRGATGSGDIILTAPSLLYTTYAASNTLASRIQSQVVVNEGTLISDGHINLSGVTAINGTNTSSLTTADFENTVGSSSGNYVWFGNLVGIASAVSPITGVVTTATNTTPGTTNIASSGTAKYSVSGSTGTVTQSTANAIINWNSFNVASNETMNFIGGNATLNRILDANPSTIVGAITGDHALFFINPNGLIVSGLMSAPTIVLSTSNITDSNFNAGTYTFARGTSTGSITNSGTVVGGINGNNSTAALFSVNVTNTGTIMADNVAVVAADSVTLNSLASGYSGVTINTPSTVSTSIDNTHGTIEATDLGANSGKVDIYSTNGTIANDNGYIYSYSNYGSSGAVTVSASGDITYTGGQIYSQSYGDSSSAGAVSVTSTGGNIVNTYYGEIYSDAEGTGSSSGAVSVTATNGAIANDSGTIDSYSSNGSSGAVTVKASGDITNRGGEIYSEAYGTGSSAGAVSVTATNGAINNDSGNIYNYSRYGSSGAVTVKASGDITNTGGEIYSEVRGSTGSSAGAVSVTSTGGNIDNSNWGYIYSDAYGTGSTSGAVSVTANGTLDTTNGGEVYSYSGSGVSSDVYLTAPTLLYTTYAAGSNNGNASYVESQGYDSNNNLTNGTIHIQANTINGAATSTLSASDFEQTQVNTWDNMSVWFGNLTFATLASSAPVTVAPQINRISATVSSQIANTVGSSNNMQTVQTTVNPVQSSFASGSSFAQNSSSSTTQNTSSTSSTGGDSNKANSSEDMTTSAAPMEGQVRFAVGHDITGSGNATAFSTSIPGVFVLSGNE